jgi:hypothetical protein
MRTVKSLPAFPENPLGLVRGSILAAKHEAVAQLGLKVGQEIVIGYDGEFVRCQGADWDIDQLVEEINGGFWEITGKADLSDPQRSMDFARIVERMEIVS